VFHQDLDADLASRLAQRFSDRVLAAAALPAARAGDIRESCEFALNSDPPLLALTCTITGSTYEEPWDGSEATALRLTDDAAEDTAWLVTHTRHYAWLRSGR
jgi:hypothetical protein